MTQKSQIGSSGVHVLDNDGLSDGYFFEKEEIEAWEKSGASALHFANLAELGVSVPESELVEDVSELLDESVWDSIVSALSNLWAMAGYWRDMRKLDPVWSDDGETHVFSVYWWHRRGQPKTVTEADGRGSIGGTLALPGSSSSSSAAADTETSDQGGLWAAVAAFLALLAILGISASGR